MTIKKIRSLSDINAFNANNFRDLRMNIEQQLKYKKEKFVVVTSSNQGEGKSYCAYRIALSFSEVNKRVLLIDFDLHRPRLSKDLGYRQMGIAAIYEDEVAIQECLFPVAENIDFLPSGYVPLNPSEIVSSKQVYQEIYSLAEKYDIIIIDCPPVLMSPDTKVIISEFRNVLFIVGSNKTRSHNIVEAFDRLKLINPTILGMVLNMKQFSKKERTRYEYK
ncbi:CpsD/CapB family tyrosine-protein kinase [Paenilisteria weihenstephanensis]|uniref:CpsD/CapB family tyrosine-protein kinase n=1 Tax=Listeria weihenstephanensis TaxID=1006155 RepID=UPI002D7F29A3|nr:CpsD/CapB family tyrosine-protein kinase [Listeria weihenstephanensis]